METDTSELNEWDRDPYTEAGKGYFGHSEWLRLSSSFAARVAAAHDESIQMAIGIAETSVIVIPKLSRGEFATGMVDGLTHMQNLLGGLDSAAEDYEKFRPILQEMFLCRTVDNFLVYIADLIAVMCHRDAYVLEKLEGVKPVPFDLLQKYTTTSEVVADIIEKRIDALSRKGMAEVNTYLKDKIALTLFPDSDDLSKAIRVVDIRNLIVHNRGGYGLLRGLTH